MGAWESAPDVPDPEEPGAQKTVAIVGLTLGYLSAVCYLFARIPQIIKNYREKSCEGTFRHFIAVGCKLTRAKVSLCYSSSCP